MIQFFHYYGYSLIFLVVFAENLGLPIPSFPLVVLAVSAAANQRASLALIFLLSAAAAMAGDGVWYVLGRVRGRPILRKLCSISLSPDSCVSRTENLFTRYGLKSLLVAKFLPGLNIVAPPMAGMLKVPTPRFILFDLGGIALWAGSALFLGVVFRAQVDGVLEWLATFGRAGVMILAVLLGGWVLLKWVERRRFYKLLERSRVSAPELKEMLDRGEDVAIVDLRSTFNYQTDGMKIRGAIHIPPNEFEARHKEIPQGRPVVMYCT